MCLKQNSPSLLIKMNDGGEIRQCACCRAACMTKCVNCENEFYCSRSCQKRDWSRHKDRCPAVTEVFIGCDKGRGLVATRLLQPGGLVHKEKAVMLVSMDENNNNFKGDIMEQFNNLSPEMKQHYLSLNCITRSGHNKIHQICISNNVLAKSVTYEEDIRALFIKFSFINHSCAPNCVFSFDEERNVFVRAVTKINPGEEITINYMDPSRGVSILRYDRQKKLRNNWDFTCCCEVCSLTGHELARNESLKRSLTGLSTQVEIGQHPAYEAKKRLSLEVEILNLQLKLGAETTRDLTDTLMRCYLFSKVLQIQGVSLTQSPGSYWKAAHDHANFLGVGYIRKFMEMDKYFDQCIKDVVVLVVDARKSAYMQTNPVSPDFVIYTRGEQFRDGDEDDQKREEKARQ